MSGVGGAGAVVARRRCAEVAFGGARSAGSRQRRGRFRRSAVEPKVFSSPRRRAEGVFAVAPPRRGRSCRCAEHALAAPLRSCSAQRRCGGGVLPMRRGRAARNRGRVILVSSCMRFWIAATSFDSLQQPAPAHYLTMNISDRGAAGVLCRALPRSVSGGAGAPCRAPRNAAGLSALVRSRPPLRAGFKPLVWNCVSGVCEGGSR